MGASNLLSPASTNHKTLKSEKGTGYIGGILYLTPSTVSGLGNLCPFASAGCKASCLYTAGRGVMAPVIKGRLRKTTMFYKDKPRFWSTLKADIERLERKGAKHRKKVFVRLNGTSDIRFEEFKPYNGQNIFEAFPNVLFYDYTKDAHKFFSVVNRYANYHLTFSRSENNQSACETVLAVGGNVAVVFNGPLPSTYLGRPVVNGDETDLRFLEGYKGLVIGLTAKGRAKKDKTGFVIRQSVEREGENATAR